MYVTTAYAALYRITYIQRTVSLISPGTDRYKDRTLINSLMHWPHDLIFITPQTLLLADAYNLKLRMLYVESGKVTTLNVRNLLNEPHSLLLTNNSLYVGQWGKMTQYKCEYDITTIHI
mgnify:CR=1 FL=1